MDKEQYFMVKKDGKFQYSDALFLEHPKDLKLLSHEVKIKILQLLQEKPLYAIEIAKELGVHEQNVYYHLNQLLEAGVLHVVEKKNIRGTTAKRYAPKHPNIGISLGGKYKDLSQLFQKNTNPSLNAFFKGFIAENELKASIIIGSPDPHGEHKARARDGHYAIEIGLLLGQLISVQKGFSTILDVNADLSKIKYALVIGGPVTNLIAAKINPYAPAKFNYQQPWSIITPKETYTEESVGMIINFKNPWCEGGAIISIAGVGNSGTRSAVLSIIMHYNELLSHYNGKDPWFKIVQGFDLDGDGIIDNVEILE